MFFRPSDHAEYHIGKVTIDRSFHTQSADEIFFSYFGNDVLYSITRIIHDDDLESFKQMVFSLSEDDIKYNVIRMRDSSGKYRWMIVKMALNRQFLLQGMNYTDVVIKDALLLENDSLEQENVINHFRYLLSVQKSIIFEYSSTDNKFAVYSFDYNINTVFVNEDFDYFRFHVTSENMIANTDLETFESFCESVKNCLPRFNFTMETSILSGGEHTQQQTFSGFTISDEAGNSTVLGIISANNKAGISADSNLIFEANLDPLTRLLNKKNITSYAVNKISECRDGNIVIAIIDVDDFKFINDRYGHLFGDEVLCAAADVMKKEIGSKGTAGRIDGDEFMIVLENINDEVELRSVLRAVRSNIAIICAEKMSGLHVTCSMGTAAYPTDADNYQKLFKTADKALYIAKEKGKDRYVIYNREKHGDVEDEDTDTGYRVPEVAINKADIVSDIITDFLGAKNMSVDETLEKIAVTFELDSVNIFWGDGLKSIFSWTSSSETMSDASFVFYDNYTDNFNDGHVFVIDNTNILEDRNSTVYNTLISNKINASVQYLAVRENQVLGLVSYDLIGHYKKWSKLDVGYLHILARVISGGFINEEYSGGDVIG